MFVVSVTVWVKAGHVDEFIAATLENARGSRAEPGNLRFDFSQSIEDPAQFLLYEVYLDEDAFKAHQQTPHYFKWRETVADWMDRNRQGIKHQSIFPSAENDWSGGV